MIMCKLVPVPIKWYGWIKGINIVGNDWRKEKIHVFSNILKSADDARWHKEIGMLQKLGLVTKINAKSKLSNISPEIVIRSGFFAKKIRHRSLSRSFTTHTSIFTIMVVAIFIFVQLGTIGPKNTQ